MSDVYTTCPAESAHPELRNGLVDFIAVYDRALSPEEIQKLYITQKEKSDG